MTNSAYVRSALAQAALEHVPPAVRKSIIEEPESREEYGLMVEAVLAFGDTGVLIQRSEIFDAIREVLSGASEMGIIDTDGREWTLRNESVVGELPTLVISYDEQRLVLPNFTPLSPNSTTRLRSLDEVSSDVNLPTDARNRWRSVLSERALDDYEVDDFHNDFCDTPVYVARSIRNETEKGKTSISSFVPNSRRYFERLVGAYDGSESIKDYAVSKGRELFEQLSGWRPYDGFLFSLFLSSHSGSPHIINNKHKSTINKELEY